MSPDNLLHKSN